MNMIRATFLLCLLASSSLIAPSIATAQDAYITINPPQRTEVAPGKIEVLGFFWYGCPHCYRLESEMVTWTRKLPAHVQFKRQPAVFSDRWVHLAQAYYALEALGEATRLHAEVFEAIHEEGRDLNTPEAFFTWAASKGVDRKKLTAAYQSFAVAAKVSKARQLSKAYPLDGVPALVINGKYLSSPAEAGGYAQLLHLADQLIARESRRDAAKDRP